MAHQSTIVENGMTYNVTEFDHTAQEIDDAVSNLGGASTPQGAIAALGAGVRPNLLINPFFRVDQRNRGTYNSGGWTLDGWYNGAGTNGTITQNSDGAELSIAQTGIAFYQPIDPVEFQLSGKKVTFSVLYSGGAPRLVISRFDGSWHHYTTANFPASENMALATVSAELGDFQSTDQIRAAIYAAANNTTFQVYCAKFEVGENQTIAYQDRNQLMILERPDPLELVKCKRYLYIIPAYYSLPARVDGSSRIQAVLQTPAKMRIKPTVPSSAYFMDSTGQYSCTLTDTDVSDFGVLLLGTTTVQGKGGVLFFATQATISAEF